MNFELLTTIGILIFLSFLGYQSMRLILGHQDRFLLWSLAFPVGSGLFTWSIFILSWIGVDHIRIATLSTSAIFIFGICLFRIIIPRYSGIPDKENILNPFQQSEESSWIDIALGFLAGILVLCAFGLSIMKSYSAWDGVAYWSIKGYGIAHENSIYAAQTWGPHGFDYPLNLQLQITMFKLISNDLLPGSKTIFPMFYTSLLLGAFTFWRSFGLGRTKALLGLILLATVPIIFHHATLGYANLAFTYFLIFAILWGVVGVLKDERDPQIISGILLGLASWTRPEGIMYCIVVITIFFGVKGIYRKGTLNLRALGIPILILGGLWNVFYSTHGGGSSQAMGSVSAAFQEILHGDFNQLELFTIGKQVIKSLLEIKSWGMLFPISIILLVQHFTSRHKSLKPIIGIGLMSSLIFGMSVIFLFYVGSYQYNLDHLLGWLGRSFDRTLIPACVMLFVISFTSLGQPSSLETVSAKG